VSEALSVSLRTLIGAIKLFTTEPRLVGGAVSGSGIESWKESGVYSDRKELTGLAEEALMVW
jgi:hypothetical protein